MSGLWKIASSLVLLVCKSRAHCGNAQLIQKHVDCFISKNLSVSHMVNTNGDFVGLSHYSLIIK
jgi:hypothetical protein